MPIYFLFYHVNTSQLIRRKRITKKLIQENFFGSNLVWATITYMASHFVWENSALFKHERYSYLLYYIVVMWWSQTTPYIKIQSRLCNDALHIKHLLSYKTISAYMFSKWMILSPKILKKIKCCDCNGNLTHNHLLRKQALDHLAKLAKWLSCIVRTYLYGAFDCMSRNSLLENSGNYRV